MHKLDDFRVYFSFGVASVLVPISYILRSLALGQYTGAGNEEISSIFASEFWFTFVIIILFVFSLSISRLVATYLIKIRRVRKWILGSKYVEGYWLLKTEKHSGDGNNIWRTGIAYMSYKLDSREFKIETTRFDGRRRYIIQSEVGYVRITGSTIRYLNFFKITYPDPDGPSGFSSGRFGYGDHLSNIPRFFDAVIAVQDGTFIGAQYAERIDDEIAEKYHKEHGSDWQRIYIEENEEVANIME